MDSNADFFVMERVASLCVYGGDVTSTRPLEHQMALRPFVSQLSVVTAYFALAFVGAIVLGVF